MPIGELLVVAVIVVIAALIIPWIQRTIPKWVRWAVAILVMVVFFGGAVVGCRGK